MGLISKLDHKLDHKHGGQSGGIGQQGFGGGQQGSGGQQGLWEVAKWVNIINIMVACKVEACRQQGGMHGGGIRGPPGMHGGGMSGLQAWAVAWVAVA
ncbi:hypothetical protein WJX77_006009 [Trebouxia sp. C0004]